MAVRALDVWPLPATWRPLVFDDVAELEAHLLAAFLVAVRARPEPRVALASGRTFAGFYASLRRAVDERRVDLSGVRFAHVDEFAGVGPDRPGSLAREIRSALFPDADPRRGSFVPCDVFAPDAAERQDSAVRGSDLCLLGVGANGHLAFNEPGAPFDAPTRFTPLTDATRAAHREAFAGAPVPATALTAGPSTLLSAREMIVVAIGAAKAAAVADLLTAPASPERPATILRFHDRVTLLLDRAAASAIDVRVGSRRAEGGPRVLRRADLPSSGGDVVFAPHPDDASISAGALLASAPPGRRRVVVTFSTGARASGPWTGAAEAAAARERESVEEAAALGAEIAFLRARGYDSGVVEEADVRAAVAALERSAPTRVVAPSRRDPHPTHRLCRLVVEEAVRRRVAEGGGPVEFWTSEGPWSRLDRGDVDVLFVADLAAQEAKRRAMARHASQMARVPFDAAAEALALLRAVEFSESHFGGKAARGFDPGLRAEAFGAATVFRLP